MRCLTCPEGCPEDEVEGALVLGTSEMKAVTLLSSVCLFQSACFSDVLIWANAHTKQELRNF